MDLFEEKSRKSSGQFAPLAERLRPGRLSDFIGQSHLVGPGKILRQMIEKDELVSMIFWGPPGVGKTTLARIIANETSSVFIAISAVTAGVKDVRKVIDQADVNLRGLKKRTILFIDEIHRFNKAQQDALLHSVEDGTVLLIGATTENPSFEVIAPLLSRCRVYKLTHFDEDEMREIIRRVLNEDEAMQSSGAELPEPLMNLLVEFCGGDARIAINAIEQVVKLAPEKDGKRVIEAEQLKEVLQKRALLYDKKGDAHYDTISAFIKSVRGSDPDAAVFWMAKMLDSGEDPLFIARRLIILASEDVGNADPFGLVLANSAFQSVHVIGMPEARIILSQVATYLASAPKSNAAYLAIDAALEDAKSASHDVPLHLRNAPTKLMHQMGYGKEYLYAHDYKNGFVNQPYLPKGLEKKVYYKPKAIGREIKIRERLSGWWPRHRSS